MKLLIKATCDFCKKELIKFQVDASVNSAISQIKTGEFEERVKAVRCLKHPGSAILCTIYVGTHEIDTWTKRIDRTKPPPVTEPHKFMI
jgi:hypothetical protein